MTPLRRSKRSSGRVGPGGATYGPGAENLVDDPRPGRRRRLLGRAPTSRPSPPEQLGILRRAGPQALPEVPCRDRPSRTARLRSGRRSRPTGGGRSRACPGRRAARPSPAPRATARPSSTRPSARPCAATSGRHVPGAARSMLPARPTGSCTPPASPMATMPVATGSPVDIEARTRSSILAITSTPVIASASIQWATSG